MFYHAYDIVVQSGDSKFIAPWPDAGAEQMGA